MPYIKQEDRKDLCFRHHENAGELNYTITADIISYLKRRGTSYQTINDILGALEGAKQEFYARIVRPYEDQKIKENGDVY